VAKAAPMTHANDLLLSVVTPVYNEEEVSIGSRPN
jgi:hypothetical protein